MKYYQQIKAQLNGEKGDQVQVWLITLLFLSQLVPQRFSYILTGLCGALWLIRGGGKTIKKTLRDYPIIWLFIGLFFVQVMGLCYTENLKAGRVALEQRLAFLLFPFIVLSAKRLTSQQVNRIFQLFTFGWLLLSLLSLVLGLIHNQEVIGEFNENTYWLLSRHELTRPVGFNAVMAALFVGFCMLWLAKELLKNWHRLAKWQKVSYSFLMCYFTAYQVLLSSRTIFVSVALLLYVGTIFRLIQQQKKLIAALAALLIPLLFFVAIYNHEVAWSRFVDVVKFEKKMEETQFGGYQLRVEIWKSAWKVIQEQPILGVGTGDAWTSIIAAHQERGFTEAVEKRFHAHNQYLHDWMTLGIMGLLLLIANFLIPIIITIKKQQFFYLSFLLLISLSCLTDITLGFYKGIFFFTLTSVLLWHQILGERRSRS